MEDIDQNRFALMAVLTRAQEARPHEYADPRILVAMSDEALRSYASGLLHSLEAKPRNDEVATALEEGLHRILHDTH